MSAVEAGHCLSSSAANAAGEAVAKRRVRRLLVIVVHLGGDLDSGMRQAEEQRLVQEFIAHPAVEAFAEAVLHRPAGRDIMPLDDDLVA